MKNLVSVAGILLFSVARAAEAKADIQDLGEWNGLIQFIPLILVVAVIFGIYKAIGRRTEATSPVASPTIMHQTDNDGRTEKFCTDCGSSLRIRAEICPNCGIRQPGFYSPPQPVCNGANKLTAALFAIFLGGLGMHKFYLGRIGQGILYLLFCWTFIPALIGLVEGIVYLSMNEQDFARKYATRP